MSLPIHSATGNRPRAEAAVELAVTRWLPRDGRAVLVAASGGRDSMTLLAAAREVLGRRVVALYVDHGVRADADENRAFVVEAARRAGVACVVERLGTGPGDGETALRRARMAAFARAAARHDDAAVLVAHHVDDVRETVALRLARGHRTPRGLAGIPTLRPLTASAPLLRPFLAGPRPLTRADLADDAARLGVAWRDDPTNAHRAVPRNATRAWLAGEGRDAGAELDAVAARARARLTALVTDAADRLAAGLAREGLGSRWSGPCPPSREALAELLRLYGWVLATPHRLDVRDAVVAALQRALEAGRGVVDVPASPATLVLHAGPTGFHAPGAPLPPRGSPAAWALTAVARGSCFV